MPGQVDLDPLLGERVTERLPAPWGTDSRTELVTLADGRRLAVQRPPSPVAAGWRVRVSVLLGDRLQVAGIPVPRLVAHDPATGVLAWQRVEGEPGSALLADPTDAVALGTEMGRLARRVASVDVAGVRLPSAWADPDRLAPLAARWLDRARPLLDPATAAEATALVQRIGPALAGRPAVLAHGDWAPVNAIVRGRAVVGIVDWEFARLADPLFDLAWWAWIVWHHHPDRYAAAAPALFETAGVELDAPTVERCRVLVGTRMLEAIGGVRQPPEPTAAAASRARWADRLAALLRTDG